MFPEPNSATVPLSVAVHRYFEVALYLLVFTGFGALAATGGLDLGTIFLVGAALLFRGYLIARRLTWLVPERWTAVLTIGYAVFYIADYFFISGLFLNATVHLVLFAMVLRLFSAQRTRDHYFLAVIAFLMVLAAAVLTVDSSFLLAFSAFMLMAVITFILMEMDSSAGKATIQSKESRDARAYRHMGMSLLATVPAIVTLILIAAAGIFFLLPRVSAGYLSNYKGNSDFSTGFSDRVELGSIGQIQQSSSVVMHIQIDGDIGGQYDLKWRGVALNIFDGKSWSNAHEEHVVQRLPGGRFMLPQTNYPGAAKAAGPLHYRVLMEPIGSNVFFLANVPTTVQGNYSMLATDAGGGVFDLDPQHPVNSYEASSNISSPDAAQLSGVAQSYPADILLNNLQLPAIDPRIPILAAQITDGKKSDYERALALEDYLRTHFGYTLQLPRTRPRDPLANFLFERKQGHCEYFASAMAVMLRSLKIPSRVVNGFRTGEFNDLSSKYVIRASNAHSWVEVYFPDHGWISFDPTPAGGSELHSEWNRLGLYVDAMASFWREWVVNYDAGHQENLGRSTFQRTRTTFQEFRDWARRHYESLLSSAHRAQDAMSGSPAKWGSEAVVSLAIVLLAANLKRLWRMARSFNLARHPGKAPRLAASIWYERMVRMIARRGWRKSASQTPDEFAGAIEDPRIRILVQDFSRCYEKARFGESAEDAIHLPEMYEEIVTAAPKSRSGQGSRVAR
ncbi:MAG: DUF3488 and transglutaminase-like domain-containing protein [Acidobacteriaceae bacterium]